MPKLCALVAYYPDRLPAPGAGYPPSLRVTVHLAGSQLGAPKFHSYSYPQVEPGFAEHDLDQFDKVAAGLAWARSLELVRKGFEVEVDLEGIWEDHSRREFLPLCCVLLSTETLIVAWVAFVLEDWDKWIYPERHVHPERVV